MGVRWAAIACGATLALGATACSNDEPPTPQVLAEFPVASAGDTVGLVANESVDGMRTVEWVDRLAGTVNRIDIDADEPSITTITTIEIGTDGEQRGLLGQALVDGRRYAAWTEPDPFELVVGEVSSDGSVRIVWTAGRAGDGAIGGVVKATSDGGLLVGLGRNTEWDADTWVGGAILRLDPSGDATQTEQILSVGYTNPWAFAALADGGVWVADNAAGPDPDDESRDDVERIGRADLVADRNDMAEVDWPERAPAAMIELPDGRLGICGFLDNELRAYEIDAGTLVRAGTIMPCNTGAAVFSDGTIVTAAQTDAGESLQILRP